MSNHRVYPDQLEIRPVTKPVNATIRVPGSKSITNRALVLAALACRNGPCKITGMLDADDTQVMIAALRNLGFVITIDESASGINATVTTTNPQLDIPARHAELYCGNSGTTMRFLTAMASLGQGEYRLDGDVRMRERPMQDLLKGLRQLGVEAHAEFHNDCPPVRIAANGLKGGIVQMRSDTSSQFVSAVMMVAPLASDNLIIQLVGDTVSRPFINMTWSMMFGQGVFVKAGERDIRIGGKQCYQAKPIVVEADATSASYFFAAAAICGGTFRAQGIPSWPIQGDVQVVGKLKEMGCHLNDEAVQVQLIGRPLHGITVDMNAISDTVPTLAAVACFADSPTTIRNVAHIRHKECDRISALCTELRKLGVEVEEYPDGLKITPRPMHGAEIETYNDHRIAMSMALIGLKVPGVVIKNPGCVAKTYPGYWEDFNKLYG